MQPVLKVQDAAGNTVVANTSSVTLALTDSGRRHIGVHRQPDGRGRGSGDVRGLQHRPARHLHVDATDGGLTDVSASIVVSVGAAAKLAFTTQPVGANGGDRLRDAAVGHRAGAGGNTVDGSTSPVTLAITTAGGAILSGCTANPKAAVAESRPSRRAGSTRPARTR